MGQGEVEVKSWTWSRERLHRVGILWWRRIGRGIGSGSVDSLDIELLDE